MIDIFRDAKNSAIAKIVQGIINEKLSDAGEVSQIKIDSVQRVIQASISLRGESEPLELTINYDITEDYDTYFFLIEKISASKEWLDILAKKYLTNQQFAIPSTYGKIADILI